MRALSVDPQEGEVDVGGLWSREEHGYRQSTRKLSRLLKLGWVKGVGDGSGGRTESEERQKQAGATCLSGNLCFTSMYTLI